MQISIGVCDAVNVECRSQVDRPPRVYLSLCKHTVRIQMRMAIAIVSTVGSTTGFGADLKRRTIQSHVHIEASIHRHCIAYHNMRD